MIFTKRFFKLNNRWYIDIPEYHELGYDFEDLEMVCGADEMLDLLSHGEEQVILTFSDIEIDNPKITLVKIEEDEFGAVYSFHKEYNVWLCNVTKYFFNDFPDKIYIR